VQKQIAEENLLTVRQAVDLMSLQRVMDEHNCTKPAYDALSQQLGKATKTDDGDSDWDGT